MQDALLSQEEHGRTSVLAELRNVWLWSVLTVLHPATSTTPSKHAGQRFLCDRRVRASVGLLASLMVKWLIESVYPMATS